MSKNAAVLPVAPEWVKSENKRGLLLDVDGTLLDTLPKLQGVWTSWASRYGLDAELVWATALVNHPLDTFARVAPTLDPNVCLSALHEIEDDDAQNGDYAAYDGTTDLLSALRPGSWAIVTGNYAHRVHIRFGRLGPPIPQVIIDANAVTNGKPHPDGYLKAAKALGCHPEECLALEDSESGIAAAQHAGMTVWAVNASPDTPGADRANRVYPTLRSATKEAIAWLGPTGE
jgi:sugar-phosphatase